MLSSVAGEVSRAGGVLGVLPAGRGNDFARMLDLPRTPEAQAALLLGGRTREVDLLACGGAARRRLGLRRGRRARRRDRGPGCAGCPAALQYPVRRRPRARGATAPAATGWSVDGVEREVSAATVVVANSAYYGKGMRIAPAASVSDGLLDVVVVEAASRLALLRALPSVYDGRHVERDEVQVLTGSRVELSARRGAGRSRSAATASRSAPLPGDGEPARCRVRGAPRSAHLLAA